MLARRPGFVPIALAASAALLGAGCNTDLTDLCNRMIACQGDPCSINQCEENLKDFGSGELADALQCFDAHSCREILGGVCEDAVSQRALRCCEGTPSSGCELELCRDVAETDPWPVQCLRESPAEVLCDWARGCDALWSGDAGVGLDAPPPPSQSECVAAAAAYDELSRIAEASACRSCTLRTPRKQCADCSDLCDVSLLP
jgi:hypothetical protein